MKKSKRKGPPRLAGKALCRGLFKDVLFRRHADSTGAFFALAYLEFDRLTFLKVRVAAGLNLRMMDEEVFAAVIGDDKSKALFTVEPLYFACTHLYSFGQNWP
jgi:hypothetical protein